MKTVLARLKSESQADATLASYVNTFATVAPRFLGLVGVDNVPFIGFAPVNSPEEWRTQNKDAIHTVEAYLVWLYTVEEDSIMGRGDAKGFLDFVADFCNVVRGTQLASDGTNYLSKPTDIMGVDYTTEPMGDNYYLLIATVTLRCIRYFSPD